MRTPSVVSSNGIALSPDEKFLYVNDSVKRAIVRYEVQRDRTVANGKPFADMSAGTGTGNPDGMKFDAKGNLLRSVRLEPDFTRSA